MAMTIQFSDGSVLKSGNNKDTVALVVSREVFDNLCQALVYMALLEAKAGATAFADDLLYLEGELQKAIITE